MAASVMIIGSGFAGLSAATFMAKAGWKVTVIEKNNGPGGRASQLKEAGFVFDKGPSWYWMPDVFERYFDKFGKRVSDYYTLKRLDPSYRIYWDQGYSDIPADYKELEKLLESFEPGSAAKLARYLAEAAYKYKVGMGKLVYKPGRSLTEFLDRDVLTGLFRLHLLRSVKSHIGKHFRNEKIRRLMEFPVLFLGALPANTPALYSLMNYADIVGGTWYPNGGMFAVVQGMYSLAKELGVEFHFQEEVMAIEIENARAHKLVTSKATYSSDVVISNADYHFTETSLLPERYRSYTGDYWNKKLMAPSCLLYFIGLNIKLENVQHHSLFFDVPFEQHAAEIYKDPQWPTNPLFYVSVNSVTDPEAAPPGCDNLVVLIPVAAGLTGDDDTLREKFLNKVIRRMEKSTGQKIAEHIVYKKSWSVSDFVSEYNSFRGNAYGLANTLTQTAIFRPSCKSRKVKNLFFAGQLTVPGPGVPPAIISGEVVAGEVLKSFR